MFVVGVVRQLIQPEWIHDLAGRNDLPANAVAVVFGVFMYFPTLVEVPVAHMFLDLGMHRGPLLAYLMADPELSLQSILMVAAVIGRSKTFTYVIVGLQAVLDAIRWVWASLWSDAAMLYRKELSLDPAKSRMAVLVQAMRAEEVSGVAFGCDPRQVSREIAIVDAVPGLCSGLVDGQVDPDRWHLRRSDGTGVEWHPSSRNESGTRSRLLDDQDLGHLLHVLAGVESLFGWPPDIEWTGQRERFTLLQARPITTLVSASEDKRAWYLTLRPGMAPLRQLDPYTGTTTWTFSEP